MTGTERQARDRAARMNQCWNDLQNRIVAEALRMIVKLDLGER